MSISSEERVGLGCARAARGPHLRGQRTRYAARSMKERLGHLFGVDAVFTVGEALLEHRHFGFGFLAHPEDLIGRSCAELNPRPRNRPTV